jgi:phosphate-selective porin OprO/OprP
MRSRILVVSLLAAVQLALLLGAPRASVAGERALMALLEVLRDNGTLGQEAYEAVQAAARAEEEEASEADVTAVATTSEAARRGPRVDVGGSGIEVESEDGEFRFALGGRLHFDGALYDGDGIPMGNGAEVRRARLEWEGTLWKDWEFDGGVDFAGNEVTMKSMWIMYTGFEPITIQVGNFKEPFSLDRLTSSNRMPFMERASPASAFAPGRHIGLGIASHGDHWTASVGAFAGDETILERDQSWATTGRVTFAPFSEKGRVLHLGAAASYRAYDNEQLVRFRERPESHVTDVRLVNTGFMEDVDDVVRVGIEAAGAFGPFFFQGEYLWTEVFRGAASSDLSFDGWYAQASWILTGESRSYKASRGIFGGVKPRRNLGPDGFGAVELGLRYSSLDLNSRDVIGGQQDILTVGLNWYVNRNIRFMANYVNVLDVDRSGSAFDDESPDAFQLRSQVDF